MTRESEKLSMDAFHHLSSPHWGGEWDPLPKWCTRNSLEWSQANTTSPTVRLWTGCVAGSAFPYWDLPLCAFAGPDHPQNHPLNHSYTRQLSIVPSAMVKWPPNEHWLPSYNYILLTHVLYFCWPLHVLLLSFLCKIDSRCVDLRCEIRLLYLLKILILTIAECELRRGFALQCFH